MALAGPGGLIAALLLIAPVRAAPMPSPPAAALELGFLREPESRAMILQDGEQIARRFDADGASRGATKNVAPGRVAIETQRVAFAVIAAGLAADPQDREPLLRTGLQALEWGFAQAGKDGSFPRQQQHHGGEPRYDGVHSKAAFLDAAARGILLIGQSAASPAIKARARALIPPLARSARWMLRSPGLTDFLANAADTNQRLVVAVMMQETALLARDPALAAEARSIVAAVLAHQTADGTLSEKGGFDSHYQSYSTELLARYEALLPGGPWHDAVDRGLTRSLRRWLASIGPDGRLDATGNTRTSDCGDILPGPGPKGKRRDKLPLRLYFIDALTAGRFGLRPIAARADLAGQRFRHKERCRPAPPPA